MSAQHAEAHHNHDATLEDLADLASWGVGATEAARRTGFTNTKTLDKYLRRQGRVDIANTLAHQDPLALTQIQGKGNGH